MAIEDDRNRLSLFLIRRGYTLVLPECPECHYGQLVRKDEKTHCTAYGQCELAPG